MQSTVLGSLVEDLDSADTSALLDRDGVLNQKELLETLQSGQVTPENADEFVKKNLVVLHETIERILNSPIDSQGQPYTDVKKYNDIINIIKQAYQQTKQANSVGHGADDWVKYSLKLISDRLLANSPRIKTALDYIRDHTLAFTRQRYLTDDLTNEEYAQVVENDPDDELKDLAAQLKVIPDDVEMDPEDENSPDFIRERIFNRVDELRQQFIKSNTEDGTIRGNGLIANEGVYTIAKTMYDNIVSEIGSNPEKALEDINKLVEYLNGPGIADDTKDDVLEAFGIDSLTKIASGIKEIVDTSKTLTASPALEIAKAIAFDLSGEQNTVLDLIESQRGELASKTRASEYLMDPEIGRHLEIAKKVLPIVQSVLWSAANGINDEANKMMAQEGKETLPVIDENLWYIYKNDLAFIQNQIDFLKMLNNSNLGAKTREQILVRNNFLGHVVDFINQQTPEGNPTEAVLDLQKALGGFNLVEAVTKLGLGALDYSDQSKENQVKMTQAFQTLEHEIFEHVKQNTDSANKVARDIMNVFPDTWQMKNGVLSRKYEDQLSNFDICTYFLAVVGYDSYEFGRKLRPIFESDGKFPFFGQEMAIRLAVAGISNPELINGAIDGINDSLKWAEDNGRIEKDPASNEEQHKKDIVYLKAKTKLYNTLIVDGFAGTGKSTVVLKTALQFFDDVEVVGISKISERATAIGLDAEHTMDLESALSKALGEQYTDSTFLSGNPATMHSHI